MAGLRDIKRRIKSVQSTRKITRAMQMVSAAKMRKSQTAVLASRTYSTLAWELILNLSEKIASNNPLLKTFPRSKKIGVVLMGTNGGFVGSLNVNLAAKLKELGSHELISEVVVYGKKAKDQARINKAQIVADFEKQDRSVTTQDIYPLAKYITDAYASGEYAKIVLVYNHFVSTLVQKPTVRQLLPFIQEGVRTSPMHLDMEYEDVQEDEDLWHQEHAETIAESDYLFEPTPAEVLDHLLPRIIESQIYQAILESDASEHSARMVMMKNATEAAGDLIADYTLTYNQLRQNKITTELAEITAGKIALE